MATQDIAAALLRVESVLRRRPQSGISDDAPICEAASRPSMRFVPVKSCEQQGVMSLHRAREGLTQERTGCINQIPGVLAEFGLVFNKSPKVLRAALADVIEDASNELSVMVRPRAAACV